jgi:hypothetical protein
VNKLSKATLLTTLVISAVLCFLCGCKRPYVESPQLEMRRIIGDVYLQSGLLSGSESYGVVRFAAAIDDRYYMFTISESHVSIQIDNTLKRPTVQFYPYLGDYLMLTAEQEADKNFWKTVVKRLAIEGGTHSARVVIRCADKHWAADDQVHILDRR